MFKLPIKLRWSSTFLSIMAVSVSFSGLTAMVIAHPLYKNPPEVKSSHPSEIFGTTAQGKGRNLPQNVLVLRVQFSDVYFRSVAAYPDNLVHDQAFFERWMLHLTDFFGDASHYQYIINYTVHDVVFNLPNTMAYYGDDTSEVTDARVPDMILETIQMADPTIDYNEYDAIIVFHAGAGQESDINSIRPGQIWSTFISRGDLQEAFDPDNDNYPGIQTDDGTIIKEIVLIPESEFQDYFPGPDDPNSSMYLFSIYGVLCHQFGHQLGLPTLFDNVSSNGRSQGIGNWGLMGTGVWNGNGNVPAQLDAWCRYYMGWETAQTINYNSQGLTVDYFLNRNPVAQRLYKVPISDREYFLIENRQQNPDLSTDPHNGQPSFTFTLLGPEEQDYYPAPDSLRPFFNFMENRYKGCEWDFFLPGLGGPLRPGESTPTDGSGLIIWHIDENVIEENFDPGFDYNHVNGDASHKGVDVEEADGIQQLDTATFDYYKYGGPFDTFRADIGNPDANNTYFGNETLNGLLHLPTAASYYGGIPLEIYDISQSGLQMTFSVRVGWKLDTGYIGVNNLDACSIDSDNDGKNEIFYPMPSGELYLWKDETLAPGFPITAPGIIKSYTWDGSSFYLALDMTTNPNVPITNLRKLQNGQLTNVLTLHDEEKWAAPVMTFDNYLAAPLNVWHNGEFFNWKVNLYDTNNLPEIVDTWSLGTDSLVANLVHFNNDIYGITKSESEVIGEYKIAVMTPGTVVHSTYVLSVPTDSVVVAIAAAKITPSAQGDIVIQTPYSVYLTDLTGNIRNGFPKLLPFYCNSPVSITDIDKNGSFEMLFGGENSFAALDYSGENVLTNFTGLSSADTLNVTSGVISGDYNGDGSMEIMGAFSRNRLAVWDDNQRLMNGFPVSFSDRSRNLPLIHSASDNLVYAWLPTDNGKIYRARLPETALDGIDNNWYCKYANLQRTASREDTPPNNIYQTSSFFVPNEVFVFPNPLKSIYAPKLTFQIMTSSDAKVDITVHDIRGNRIFEKKIQCRAWLKNREQVDFPVDHLSGGVYIAVIKSGNDIKRIKFAVEK
jgi:M6 family metalloprotease-like protein